MSLDSIEAVIQRQLCTGCGACAYAEPKRFRMADAIEHGTRPVLVDYPAAATGDALNLCPGVSLEHGDESTGAEPALDPDLRADWGPALGVWEGYAGDPDVRHAASSGGAATALALYCLEQEAMTGVLHTGPAEDAPYLNASVISTTRAELLARTGSRYAPASPVERLGDVETAAGRHVFIGKPCDVAAVRRARQSRPRLDANLGLLIGFFCAGTPSTRGTLDLLRSVGVNDPSRITRLKYRGDGWPGMWRVTFTDDAGQPAERTLSYEASWGFLQRYRQWRCYICPDHTGEFADIAVGDPWYRALRPDEPGRSLLVVRTRRGLEVLHAAAAAGYIVLEKQDPSLLPRSQPNLLETRAAIWGRLIALRLLGAAVPNYRGFRLGRLWLRQLTPRQKLQSIAGAAKRTFTKRLRVPLTPGELRGRHGSTQGRASRPRQTPIG